MGGWRKGEATYEVSDSYEIVLEASHDLGNRGQVRLNGREPCNWTLDARSTSCPWSLVNVSVRGRRCDDAHSVSSKPSYPLRTQGCPHYIQEVF
jgi:hypothetical protein